MSRNYKFHNPEGIHFVSYAVVVWLVAKAEGYFYSIEKIMQEKKEF